MSNQRSHPIGVLVLVQRSIRPKRKNASKKVELGLREIRDILRLQLLNRLLRVKQARDAIIRKDVGGDFSVDMIRAKVSEKPS